ncbi:MAG: winged helix-turn-helix domain-containing protein [Methylotenera sp.]|nr:winged helix-turn-helix domain-containing protein [Oligoflexia bacterium]
MKSPPHQKKSSAVSAKDSTLTLANSSGASGTTGKKRPPRPALSSARNGLARRTPPKASKKVESPASILSVTAPAVSATSSPGLGDIEESLNYGRALFEKCDLLPARTAFLKALDFSRRCGNIPKTMESLSFLLRLAAEALDEKQIAQWEAELNQVMSENPSQLSPKTWYCKGMVARYQHDYLKAQKFFHRALREFRVELKTDPSVLREYLQCWHMVAVVVLHRGCKRRSFWLIEKLLAQYESVNLRGINGGLYVEMGMSRETLKDFDGAMVWYQKAHAAFLAEHNWYAHLYVLYAYARIARHQKNYSQAYWFIDLVEKAAAGNELVAILNEMKLERKRLEDDAIDLLIDSRKAVVKTREGGQISLRKQYVLLNILEALSAAHGKDEVDAERGLSKAEIIETVWKESYRPEAHDNKLYYNINRLRKLIEPDVRQPQYLLNWKEGYRLAPGLRVHLVGGNKLLREGES